MLSKVLFTIAAVVAIWKAFSLISKLQKDGGIFARDQSPRRPDRPAEPKAVEMKPCLRCGAYVDPREGCRCSTSST